MVFIYLTLSTVLLFIMVTIIAHIYDEGTAALESRNISDQIIAVGSSMKLMLI